MFAWYELRTLDPAAARAFYAEALGLRFREQEGRTLLELDGRVVGEITVLPEAARARGAPSHWLGHIAVADVERAMAAMGATPLGPERRIDGHRVIGARDPSGVPIALTDRPMTSPLACHELHGAPPSPLAPYAAVLELEITGSLSLDLGEYVLWQHRGFSGGAIASAHRPGVHPHWEHYFAVSDLDVARTSVGGLGGEPLPVQQMPDGARLALAHDPWGASFGLRELAQDRGARADGSEVTR